MAIREIAKRLAKGGGIGESISGGVRAGLKQYSPGNIMKRTFSGDDLLSSFIRGRFADKKPTRTKTTEVDKKKNEAPVYISIIAKNSMSLPGMARDMNVLRQNIVQLVKLQGGDTTKFGGEADEYFMREDARERALEKAREDERDSSEMTRAELSEKRLAGFMGIKGLKVDMGQYSKGNFLSNIFKNIVEVIGKTFATVFGGKILKGISGTLLKAFPIALLLGGLFVGLKEAWKKYQDTGDFGEAIVGGLGKVLEFATFGLFGEDTIKSVIEKLNTFFEPFKETFSKIWNGITGVFTKIASALGFDFSAPEMPDIKPEISAPPADSVDTSTEAFRESYTSDAKPDEVTTTSTSPVSVKSGSDSKGIDLMSGGVTPVAEQKVTADSSYLQKTSAVESPQNNMMNNFLNLAQGSGKAQTDSKSQGTSGPTYNNNMNLNAVEDVPPNIELKGNSGGALGTMSSDVAKGKMMEPYADSMSNNIIDASKKNSAVGSAGGTSDMPIANVYDDDLVELLVGT